MKKKKIPNTKIGLMEWPKVWALSSNPSTTKKKGERKKILFYASQKVFIHFSRHNGLFCFVSGVL
jgi:hypothetical protein